MKFALGSSLVSIVVCALVLAAYLLITDQSGMAEEMTALTRLWQSDPVMVIVATVFLGAINYVVAYFVFRWLASLTLKFTRHKNLDLMEDREKAGT